MKRIHKNGDVPTTRVDLEGGDWVEGKTFLVLNDRDKINSGLMTIDMETGEAAVDTSKANVLTLLQTIVSWGGPGFCQIDHEAQESTHTEGVGPCEPEPITAESISGLDETVARLLLKQFTAKHPRPVPPKGPAVKATNDGENSAN
jgi:hypothetical protein